MSKIQHATPRTLECFMIRRAVSIWLLSLVLCGAGQASEVQVTTSAGFLRSTIEAYPEFERRPILDYLDSARLVAEDLMKNIAVGKIEGLARVLTAIDPSTNEADVRRGAELMAEAYGIVTSYEYRGQAIEASEFMPDVHDLASATGATFMQSGPPGIQTKGSTL